MAHLTVSLAQLELEALREDENEHSRATPLEIEAWTSSESLSDETLVRIRELLKHAEHRLDVIDEMIWQISRTSLQDVMPLIQQREQDMAYIRLMRGTISTLNRVPPEVLSRIFVHYIGGKLFIPPIPAINPWKLGHVSSYWRKVLWSTPEVWKIIEILPQRNDDTNNIEELLSIRTAIEDIFSRSGTTHSVIVNHQIAPISNLISPLSNRITSLSLNHLSLNVLDCFVELPRGSWGCLETLDISLCNDRNGLLPHSLQSSFQSAPNLRVVSITLTGGTSDFALPLSPIFPWPQLTHLTITQITVPWRSVHHILAQCVAIVDCNFTVRGERDMSILTLSTIALTNLESFEISQDGTLNWAVFLSPFVFPALKHMSIMAGVRILHPEHEIILANHMDSPQGITEMVLRSNCRLETLLIGGDLRHNSNLPLIDLNIETLLHSSPTLRMLIGSFTLPPSVFVSMQANHLDLSHLECVVLRLRTHGLRRFLDLLDYHIICYPEKHAYLYNGSIKRAEIWCRQSPATTTLYKRYQRMLYHYQRVGADILINLEDHDGEISDEDNGEEDGDDEGDDNRDPEDDEEENREAEGEDNREDEGDSSREDNREDGYVSDRVSSMRLISQTRWLPHYVAQLLSSVV